MLFRKILNILRFILITSGLLCLIIGLVFELIGNPELADIFLLISSVLGSVGLILIIIYFIFFTSQTLKYASAQKPKERVVKTVDVKEIPKTKEEKLYEQYEALYKKNLITKEDLDLKRKELLGK